MSNRHSSERDTNPLMVYQIRIRGHLGPQWTVWFEGLTITLEVGGDTLLTGEVVDQAALHGILKKVRDLGMPLLSVNSIDRNQAGMPVINQVNDEQKAASEDQSISQFRRQSS